MTAAIETTALTKSYGRARGIIDVDLRVEPGEVFGFLGPNGAGKTTMIRVLLDLIRPSGGSARVLGLDAHADAVAVHARVGYVPGNPALYDRLTGRELCGWLGRLRGDERPAAVDALAARLALDLDRPIRVLSSGNRQKVALVQAFAHRPDLLLLDEPTSGLDPKSGQEFLNLLIKMRDEGKSVFMSTHDIFRAKLIADRVGFMRKGRLVMLKTRAELMGEDLTELYIQYMEEREG